MPYIKQSNRALIDGVLDPLCRAITVGGASPGEVNYIVTRIMLAWVKSRARSYEVFNHVVGILESAKLEFYRRAVVPYETDKQAENGDVYEEAPAFDPRGQKPTVIGPA